MKQDMTQTNRKNNFEHGNLNAVLSALEQGAGNYSSALYYGLSGLNLEQIDRLRPIWGELPADYRRSLAQTLVDISENNFEFDYGAVARLLLEDEDAQVREAAVELLWPENTLEVMDLLIHIAETDVSNQVRAAAVGSLGLFIYSGEVDDLPADQVTRAKDTARRLFFDPTEGVEVRRRALEAYSNCSEDDVADAIWQAYNSGIPQLRISAVYAMGRSYDQQFEDVVLKELDKGEPEMRYEAARAAGELGLEEAVPALSRLAFGDDIEIRDVAIWSLGEIGGKEAADTLNLLLNDARVQRDSDLREEVEEALFNANISQDMYLLNFDPELALGFEDVSDDDEDEDEIESDEDD